MTKNRVEAFSDGVIAIIITIMVLELKPPAKSDLESLLPLWHTFVSYLLSFVFVGIYWNNHHHLLHATHRINGWVLWANLNLLFWLSMFPFVTNWMGATQFALWPVVLYGVICLLCAFSYYVLVHAILRLHEKDSAFARALGRDFKGKISILIYLVSLVLAFYSTLAACLGYVLVALIWLVPDKRMEKAVKHQEHQY